MTAKTFSARKDQIAYFLEIDRKTATYKLQWTDVLGWRAVEGSNIAQPMIAGTRKGTPMLAHAVELGVGRYAINGVIVTSLREWVLSELAYFEKSLPADQRIGVASYREIDPGFCMRGTNGGLVVFTPNRFAPDAVDPRNALDSFTPAQFRPSEISTRTKVANKATRPAISD